MTRLTGGIATLQIEKQNFFQLSDKELCYFAALIHGLRLINEKEAEKGIRLHSVDALPLIIYVSKMGDHLYKLFLAENG